MSLPSDPIVQVDDVEKTFTLAGTFPWSPKTLVHAVRGVSLRVEPGEVVALVGQSGSGKTTLSRIILGLEEPSKGTIHLDGMRWDGLSEGQRHPHRLPYQYVPQDAMSALDPQQNALEAVSETLRVLRQMDRETALHEARAMLTQLGLGERVLALPREMSGGEQRRVTLARVLALQPRLVVADEPTSGLEPDRRESVLEDLVGNLPAEAGCVLVTHDMGAARRWAHRVLVMLDGRVIEELDLRKTDPAHPYSRMLFDPWAYSVPQGELSSSGCPFSPDCPKATGDDAVICKESLPKLRELSTVGHRVACHHTNASKSDSLSHKGGA
jgi:peptide/nickel transport system ATP-binding protein